MGLSLVEYSKALPLAADPETGYSLAALASDLLGHARANLTANGVVVPVLQTFNVLLEADALRRLPENSQGETRSVVWGYLAFALIFVVQPPGFALPRDQECRPAEECPEDSRVYENVCIPCSLECAMLTPHQCCEHAGLTDLVCAVRRQPARFLGTRVPERMKSF